MKFKDWKPPVCRATWFVLNHLTKRERILCAALDALIMHDNAADVREDLPNCSELQHAMEVINEFAGDKFWEPRT